ncbi:MAG: PepSY-like domain-containing protein [Cytophagales bacterium]|nr:PepSY-like domain-containing protein [Cytophagales bacterium]
MTIVKTYPCTPGRRPCRRPALLAAAFLLICGSLAEVRAQTARQDRKTEKHETRSGNKEERATRRAVRKLLRQGEIPVVVASSFTSLYPEVTTSQWYACEGGAGGDEEYLYEEETEPAGVAAETDTYYDVVFLKDGKEHHSIFNRAGKWFETRRKMEAIDLPDPVLQTLEDKYGDWEVVTEKEEVKRHDAADVLYRVKLRQGPHKRVLYLDPAGNVVHHKKF